MKRFIYLFFFSFAVNTYAQDSIPGIQWQKCIGGSANELNMSYPIRWESSFRCISKDKQHIIMATTTNSNSGEVVGGLAGVTDIWLAKLDLAGGIVWRKKINIAYEDELSSVSSTSDGGAIIIGHAAGNSQSRQYDAFVAKYDKNGNQEWFKPFGGAVDDHGGQVIETRDGSFVFGGSATSRDGAFAGVPGTGYAWLAKTDNKGNQKWMIRMPNVPQGLDVVRVIKEDLNGNLIVGVNLVEPVFPNANHEILIAKVNSANGAIVWTKTFGGTYSDLITDIEQIAANKFVFVGATSSNDGDMPLPYLGTAQLGQDAFYLFFDSSGTLGGGKRFGGFQLDHFNDVEVLSDGSLLFLGSTRSTDGDLTGSNNHGEGDVWLLKTDQAGNIKWSQTPGGSSYERSLGLGLLSDNEFYFLANTASNNFDVSGNRGNWDMWLVKMGSSNTIKGTVFYDQNLNGTKDADELLVNDIMVSAKNATSSRSTNSQNGKFSLSVGSGPYAVTLLPQLPYYNVVPSVWNVTFPGYFGSDSSIFALQPIQGKNDLQITVIPESRARPGFPFKARILYKNIGTTIISNPVVKIPMGNKLSINNAIPVNSQQSNDTLIWQLAQLKPHESGTISVQFQVAPPPAINNGDTLSVMAQIEPIDTDLGMADNTFNLRILVTGSYDPNDKSESNAGVITQEHLYNNEYLSYHIRFQNVGTDTAFNIVVRDTLDAKLDWNSLEMVAASHSYQLQNADGNKLTWSFNNILLPDSNVNEPASNGYISYRIKPLPAGTVGDVIKNSASIYFDFNLPVKTNVHLTEIKAGPPPQPVIAGLQTSYCSNAGLQKAKINNMPASGSGIVVSVKIDGNTVAVGADSSFSFTPGTLSEGSHSVTVQFSNSTANRTSSSDFTITTAVNPEVNVSANITNITSLATNVIVTATNAAGGGTIPLYTFARDRNFTNIVQAESAVNNWTFNPSILSIGDNRIYVRMKTSSNCFVVNTNIDSILLVRSSVTGITDPDMPGQVINIYPNPFKDAITINGLSSSKTYTIRLFNLEGKQLINRRISGRTSMTIPGQHQAKGIYWLSIYDEKRYQLLGSIKMMKE